MHGDSTFRRASVTFVFSDKISASAAALAEESKNKDVNIRYLLTGGYSDFTCCVAPNTASHN